MSLRRTLFTLYGMGIGLAYVAVLAIVWPLTAAVTVVLAIIVGAIFTYFGNRLPREARMSTWQLLVAIPLFPFAMLGGMIGIGFVLPVVGIVWSYAAIKAAVAVRQFRMQMKWKNRFATLEDLRPQLIAGKGTVIEETGPKGPYRLWWTEDDLFALGAHISTDEEFISILTGGEHPFNSRCLRDYLDKETGKALLTSIPPRHAASGKLVRLFPQVKVASVVRPFAAPRRERVDGQ